jgi:hypothetical protein
MSPQLDLLRPVPIEVRDTHGRWHPGFLLLRFRPDGLVTVRSRKTGAVKHLRLDQWRDPIEEAILRRHGLAPAPAQAVAAAA